MNILRIFIIRKRGESNNNNKLAMSLWANGIINLIHCSNHQPFPINTLYSVNTMIIKILPSPFNRTIFQKSMFSSVTNHRSSNSSSSSLLRKEIKYCPRSSATKASLLLDSTLKGRIIIKRLFLLIIVHLSCLSFKIAISRVMCKLDRLI